jgi:hypothetical protein
MDESRRRVAIGPELQQGLDEPLLAAVDGAHQGR